VNTTLLHRRRIERLAQLLDEAEGARRHHTRSPLDDDLNDLVDVGHRLMDIHPQVEMRESARRDIRAVIMAAAQRDGIGVTAKTTADPAIGRARVGAVANTPGGRRPFARRVRARGAVLVGLAVGTLAVSGIAAASGTAMPGDALYGLKRSQETAQLQLSGSRASKGQLYLDFAGKRLAEAQTDTGDPNGLTQLINQMDSDTLQGARLLFAAALASHDKAALQTVADFYSRQKDQLSQLRSELRPETPTYVLVLRYDNELDLVNYRWQQINAALDCPTVVQSEPDNWGPTVEPCGSAAGAGGGVGAGDPSTPPTGYASAAPDGSSAGKPDTTKTASTPSEVGAGAASLVPRQTSGGVLDEIQHALGGLLG
jgi:Domain of unknown function (DUF5667)